MTATENEEDMQRCASTRTTCSTCGDKHEMVLRRDVQEARFVMCTRCPVPCQKCRAGGNGPFCENTPCVCLCHVKPGTAALDALTVKEPR